MQPLLCMKRRSQSPHYPECLFQYMSLPMALTVQAAVVVLPVCTHSILFTNKHHFGHTHPDQASSLQGTTHTEQLLRKKCTWLWVIVTALSKISWTLNLNYSQMVEFTHNYVLFGNPGMQVVHRYFGPLQRTESRLENEKQKGKPQEWNGWHENMCTCKHRKCCPSPSLG